MHSIHSLMGHLAYRISEIAIHRFLEIWAFILFSATSIALFCGYYEQRRGQLKSRPDPNIRPPRPSCRLEKIDIVCLAFFILFLALYIYVQLWGEDFAFSDSSQITQFALRGRNMPPPIWPSAGRLFPLQFQDLNVLKYLTRSPVFFHAFGVLELLAWVVITIASFPEFTIPLRLLASFLIMSTLSFATSFSDLTFPERNILFWLAVFILCRRRYSTTSSPLFLAGTFVSVQFALYYKEPVWLLFAAFAGANLMRDWNRGTCQRSVWRFAKDNVADMGTLALSVLFPILFALIMFPSRSLAYVTTHQFDLLSTFLRYMKVDLLLFVFLAVIAVRVVTLLRGDSKFDSFWDPLAAGGALYALAIIGLRMFACYYMAPVDAIAILFLVKSAHSWLSWKKPVRTLIVAAVCFVTLVQNVGYASVYFIARKNIIAGDVKLAEFLKGYVQGRSNGSVGLFFPYSSGGQLMELSSFLDYKGLAQFNSGPADQQGRASLLFKSPLSFPQNRCVDFRENICLHAGVPDDGDLIVELARNVPSDRVSENRRELLLFSYQPFLVSQESLPFFKNVMTISDKLTNRWLEVRVYRYSAPDYPGKR